MLEDLSGREFEVWVKVLLERHLGHEVEDQPYVADEGRDLIVKDPDGDVVVECKHYPNGSVGRPVVQKLHSAVLTGRANRGMVATTGRFTLPAQRYAESVEGVEIELVDGTRLAYIAETVGLAEGADLGSRSAWATRTTPEASFAAAFTDSVFTEPRFVIGRGYERDLEVVRATVYEGVYVADFVARGSLDTAGGTRRAAWQGRVWCSHDGRQAGVGEPPLGALSHRRLVPLGEALASSPGETAPPSLRPHKAVRDLEDHLLASLGKTIRYTGRNNVTYTRTITPSRRDTHAADVQLVYCARQSFVVRGPHDRAMPRSVRGNVIEHGPGADADGGRQTSFLVWSGELGTCRVCRRAVEVADQVICAVCLHAAHHPTLLRPDSGTCAICAATVCRDHLRRRPDLDDRVCTRCADQSAEPLRPRWLPHVVGALLVMVVLVLMEILLGGSQVAALAVAAALAWLPAGYVATTGSGEADRWLRYGP